MATPRRSACLAAALVALAVAAGPAAAHVTVDPDEAPKGGFAKLAFRTPNERPDSGTVRLEVTFPTDHPLQFVSVRPQPGWTFTVEKRRLERPVPRQGEEPVTEAVSRITWAGGPINPGEFQDFEVSAGPLPEDADELVFKAVQTYASGEVVRWIEEAAPGGAELEHPAPVLKLAGARGRDGEAAEQAGTAGTDPASTKDVDDARRLAVIALAVGGLGALLGLAGLVRRRPS